MGLQGWTQRSGWRKVTPMTTEARSRSTRLSRYMLKHMRSGCCYPWPFNRAAGGYVGSVLWEGRLQYVCRVVCTLHRGRPPRPDSEVRHVCGKGMSGCWNADCMRWGSRAQNERDKRRHRTYYRGGRPKLSYAVAQRIRKERLHPKVIAQQYGVSVRSAYMLLNGTTWRKPYA